MFIESPATTTPEVETDTALDHLYKIREMAEEEKLCRGLSRYDAPQQEWYFCPIGWAGVLNGWNYSGGDTGVAKLYANKDVIAALEHATNFGGIPSYNDTVVFKAHYYDKALALDWIDRAIEYRKKQL